MEWNVTTAPIQMSREQLNAFTNIIDDDDHSAQSLGARALIEDTSPQR